MSHERFDEDLRLVLLEDSPPAVPDDLRQRVADVARVSVSAGPSRGRWSQLVPRWVGALAVLGLVLVVGLWQLVPVESDGVEGQASASPSVGPLVAPSASVASPSPTPSPTRSGSTAPEACRGTDLVGRIRDWGGAAGSRIAVVEISNASTTTCIVRGTLAVALVDAGGRVLLDSATSGPAGRAHVMEDDPRFRLAPGAHLRTQVETSNYCGPDPSPPLDITFTLPAGRGQVVAMPEKGVGAADGVPPCLGPSGGAITMNGWRK